MEGAKWELRKCYVRLWKCDLDGRACPRDDRVVFVPPPELGAADHVLEYGDVFKTTIKCERDEEISVTAQSLDTVFKRLREGSVGDPVWHVDEEDGFVVKMEEIDEVMVKHELEVGPTVLQPPPAPRTQAGPDPRPSTSSGGCGAPAAFRTAESHTWNDFILPTSRLKAQDGYCVESAGDPSSSRRALSERSDDCTVGEDTAEDKREDGQQCECVTTAETLLREILTRLMTYADTYVKKHLNLNWVSTVHIDYLI